MLGGDHTALRDTDVEVVSLSGARVLRLCGEHDIASAHVLMEMIESAVAVGDVIVDLNEAEFIDSSVIHAVTRGHRAARASGRDYLLCIGRDHPLRRVVAIAELDRSFPVVEDAAVAEARLISSRGEPATVNGDKPPWWAA
jgi:anti-anti-sigma factor